MELSKETMENIQKFAKENASGYLSDAELSVFERLAKKGDRAKSKIIKNVSRLKVTSDQSKEAADDLSVYMEDYIEDLVSEGHTEEEAFELAKKTLSSKEGNDFHEDIQEKYKQYYLNRDLGEQEAIGLYYGGFLFLGLVLGAAVGAVLGIAVFTGNFWSAMGTCIGIGAAIGLALGMIKHASIATKK